MKKLSLFFCLLLALMITFQACNNEDEATPAPSISNLSPLEFTLAAGATETLTITGAHFGTEQSAVTVTMGGSSLAVQSVTDTQIEADVTANTTSGTVTVTVNGQSATSSESVTIKQAPVIGDWLRDETTEVVEVVNPTTGKIWMDRNLGASQVATSSTDAAAYGDLYQWGRAADGHESRTSATTTTLATSDTPGHGDFITNESSPYDWHNPQNENLWQGVNGINNPCPIGYRLPTEAEWEEEINTWSSTDAAGAFDSPLKLPLPGKRYRSGTFDFLEEEGHYWSSTIINNDSRYISIEIDFNYSELIGDRASGNSVRCIKD